MIARLEAAGYLRHHGDDDGAKRRDRVVTPMRGTSVEVTQGVGLNAQRTERSADRSVGRGAPVSRGSVRQRETQPDNHERDAEHARLQDVHRGATHVPDDQTGDERDQRQLELERAV